MENTISDQKSKRYISLFHERINLLCLLAFVASLLCKLFMLNSRELWLDETYSAFATSLSFRELLRFTTGDVHPQLFSILLWGWVHLVGNQPAKLRLFSVLLNACCMVAMYYLGRCTIGTKWGSFAAILFSLSPMLLVYSLEVRSYTLFLLVFLCALIAYCRIVMQARSNVVFVTLLAFLLALLFYIHYLAVFFIIGIFVHWLTRCFGLKRCARPSTLLFAVTMTLTLIAPGIPLLLKQRRLKADLDRHLEYSHYNPVALSYNPSHDVSYQHSPTIPFVVAESAMAGVFPAKSKVLLTLCAMPLIFPLVGTVYYGFLRKDEVCRLFIITAILSMAGLFLLHLVGTRYTLSLAPLLILAIARVFQRWCSHVEWRLISLGMLFLVFATYCAGFIRQMLKPHSQPWASLVEVIKIGYRPGDHVIFDALYAQVPFDYFANQSKFYPSENGFPISIYDWWSMQEHRAWGGPIILRSDLDRVISSFKTEHGSNVWVVSYENYYYDPNNALLEALGDVGTVTEVLLPPDIDSPVLSGDSPTLRLFRVALH